MIVSNNRSKMAPTTTKKILLKPAPITSKTQLQTGQQIIVLPSNFIQQISNAPSTATFKIGGATVKPASIVVPAAVKRPATTEDEDALDQPIRKRANLDHLTPEEKMMRRKLKNRVAAQNARDKKRTKMDEIEIKLKELEEANAKLLLENESLRALNERLMEEKYTNTQVTTRYEAMPGACTAPMTPPHSESTGSERSASPAMSSLSSSDCSLVDSRSFESAEESGSRVGRIVDGGDGDHGPGGILPCGLSSGVIVQPQPADIAEFEQLLGGGGHQETPSVGNSVT